MPRLVAATILLTPQHRLSNVATGRKTRLRELTARQRDVLNFMRAFTARHGVPPTVREIGDKFCFTPRAAFDHLRALERKGMLQRRAGGQTARALTLSAAAGGRAGAGIPILGR